MIRHYYTLTHLKNELACIKGFELVECFTQDKGILIMVYADGKSEHVLEFSTIPNLESLFIKRRFARARKNTVELFPDIKGRAVEKIDVIENNRIIFFDFGKVLSYFFLFGGSRNNCFIVKDGIIIDSFKDAAINFKSKFEISSGNLRSFNEFQSNISIMEALTKCDLLLGKYYAEEVCVRLQINKDLKIGDIDKSQGQRILSTAKSLREECLLTNKFYLYSTDRKDWLLSLIPLQKNWEMKAEYKSISEAIQNRIVNTIKDRSYSSLYNEISKIVTKELNKIETNLAHIDQSEKTEERADNYKKWAEILISQPNARMKPGSEIKLTDWEGNDIVIPLDPKLSLIQNSEKYFEKASKSIQAIKERLRLLPAMLKRKEMLKLIEHNLKNANSIKELINIKKSLIDISGIRMKTDDQNKETRFRTFDLGEGFTLYVGKNAANNDELTMKFAKPNDLWFHARGAGGSHVVLRLDKGEKPGKHIIEKAASIAAYYSQQRKSKMTPVAYTFKKYVRKPKGANPGSVVLAREDVIMARPKSPDDVL